MRDYYLTFIFIVFTGILFSQVSRDDSLLDKGSYVTFNLFTPADALNPRYRMGVVQRWDSEWMSEVSFGYGNSDISYLGYQDRAENNYKLWEARIGLRRITQERKKSIQYVAPELFYIDHSDIINDAIFFPEGGTPSRFDQANFNRKKYGINIKYGMILNSKKRISFDFYTGVGLGYRNNTFSNVINRQALDLRTESVDVFSIDNYIRDDGFEFILNGTVGLNIVLNLKPQKGNNGSSRFAILGK